MAARRLACEDSRSKRRSPRCSVVPSGSASERPRARTAKTCSAGGPVSAEKAKARRGVDMGTHANCASNRTSRLDRPAPSGVAAPALSSRRTLQAIFSMRAVASPDNSSPRLEPRARTRAKRALRGPSLKASATRRVSARRTALGRTAEGAAAIRRTSSASIPWSAPPHPNNLRTSRARLALSDPLRTAPRTKAAATLGSEAGSSAGAGSPRG